jgi:uncharacterized protein (TIGR03435 family)
MRTVLTLVAVTAFAGLIAASQQQNPTQPREAFDVVSIRRNTAAPGGGGRGQAGGGGTSTRNDPCTTVTDPGIDPTRFDTTNTTVVQLIGWAYGVDCNTFRGLDLASGGPDWIKSDGYDVQATRPEGPSDYSTRREGTIGSFVLNTPGPKIRRMLQTMLADRFKLEMHRETKEMPVYVLTVAQGGPKHTASRPSSPAPQVVNGVPMSGSRGSVPVNPEFSIWKEGDNPCCQSGGLSEIDGRKKTMADLATTLSASWIMNRTVLDRTGLTGDFNYYFRFAPMDPNARPSPEGPFPTTPIFKALEQIGLELKESREKVEVWVIDRVETPSEN